MFKLKYDGGTLPSFNDLFEAKKNALLTLKHNPNLKLVEVLNEDDEVIFTKENELPKPTNDMKVNAVDALIVDLISNCWENINKYNSVIATLLSEKVGEDTISTLNSIVDDLNIHVGKLQSCLSNSQDY